MPRLLRLRLPGLFLLGCAAVAAQDVTLDPAHWKGVTLTREVAKDDLTVVKWSDLAKNTKVTLADAPADWSRFRSLRFWAYCPAPTDSRISLIVMADDPATKGPDYYSLNFRTQWSGWREFVLPRSRLRPARRPRGWRRVGPVFFSSTWCHHLDPATTLFLAGFTLSAAPAPGDEPLPPGECLANGGFEVDLNFDGRPDGWGGSGYGTRARVSLDRTTAYEGKASVKIVSPEKSARGGWSFNIADRSRFRGGAAYLFRAYCKTRNVVERGPGVCARITYVGPEGKVIRADYVKPASLSDRWRRVEGVVVTPKNTIRFNVVLFLNGSGAAWWDAASLRRLGPPVEIVSPRPGALVEERRPRFEWKAVPGAASYTLECSSDPAFGDAATQRVAGLKTTAAALPKPLTPGRAYYWRVRAAVPGGLERMSLVKEKDGRLAFPQFFSGTWRERCAPAVQKLEAYRRVRPALRAFAARNHMWDVFSRLDRGIARLERLLAAPSPEGARMLARLDREFADLDLFVAWWRRTFLGDKEFLQSIDFDYPGLEKARAAYRRGDLAGAKAALAEHFRTREKPVYFFNPGHRPPANPKRRTDKRAEQLLTHRYPIHSYKTPTFDLGREFNWHVNPIIDREWPTKLHRHYAWTVLASAYWITHNERYAREWKLQLLDWVEDNPIERWDPRPGRCRFAWSTLNAASRMIHAWPQTYLRCRRSPAFDVDAATVFLKLIREHGRYLMTHHARGGNWLIAESNALAVLGVFYPEFKEAKAWREKGYQRLTEQLFAQTFDDGVHIERTPGYHAGCISLFLRGLQLALLNHVEFKDKDRYLARIEKMYDFYLYGARPDGVMPMLGDVGVMKVNRMLTKAAAMFHRPDMLFVATGGKQGVKPVETSHAFPGAGLYAMRSDWTRDALFLFFDCGGFYGHCHRDIFHVDVYAYGRLLLTDAGRYAYAAQVNQYFRGTIGHNTVLVDRKNQAKQPAPKCLAWTTCAQFDYLHGRHTNYPGVAHERKALFIKPAAGADGYWVVVDLLTGKGTHRCDQRWQFNPDLPVAFRGLTARSTRPKSANLIIAAPASPGLSLGKEKGWVSYRWYQKEPTVVAQYARRGPLPQRFETVLYPVRPGADAGVTVRRAGGDGRLTALQIEVQLAGRTAHDVVVFQHGPARRVQAAGLATDAQAAYVRVDDQGRLVRAFMQAGSSLEWRGRPVLSAPGKLPYAAAAYGPDAAIVSASPTPRLDVRAGRAARFVVNGRVAPAAHARPGALVTFREVQPPARRPVPREPGPPAVLYTPIRSKTNAAASLASLPVVSEKALAALRGAARVEAENFAAEGGGSLSVSRKKVGASGACILHWDAAGHWVEWRFRIPRTGEYALIAKVCTQQNRALRRIELDGRLPSPALAAVEFPYTGGYSNRQDDWECVLVGESVRQPARLRLAAGEHTLRMTNVAGESLNVDFFVFAPVKSLAALKGER